MNRETKDRLLLPIGVPLFALIVIGFVLYAFSRILLAVPHEQATPIALALALNVLTAGALIASMPRLRSRALVALMVVGALVLGGGSVTAMAVSGELEELFNREPSVAAEENGETPPGEEPGEAPVAPVGPGGTIIAQNTAFNTDAIELPAGAPATITFQNDDPISHNVAIHAEGGGDPLFTGEIFSGPDEKPYEIPALQAGTYPFQCDVHPAMKGTVTVA